MNYRLDIRPDALADIEEAAKCFVTTAAESLNYRSSVRASRHAHESELTVLMGGGRQPEAFQTRFVASRQVSDEGQPETGAEAPLLKKAR